MTAHEWITVLSRRWCLCCDAYEQAPFKRQVKPCPMTTPYASGRKTDLFDADRQPA